jgi:hypothetical protein
LQLSPQSYNTAVPARNSGPHIYSREAAGLLIISVLIFILILVRYWHNIHWNAR